MPHCKATAIRHSALVEKMVDCMEIFFNIPSAGLAVYHHQPELAVAARPGINPARECTLSPI